MTLADTKACFAARPSYKAAERLLTTGSMYWHDGLIDDEEFDYEVVKPVRDWMAKLATEGVPINSI